MNLTSNLEKSGTTTKEIYILDYWRWHFASRVCFFFFFYYIKWSKYTAYAISVLLLEGMQWHCWEHHLGPQDWRSHKPWSKILFLKNLCHILHKKEAGAVLCLSKLYFMQENIDRLFLFQPSKTIPSSTLCTIDNDNICVGSERAATTHICNTRKKGNNIKWQFL